MRLLSHPLGNATPTYLDNPSVSLTLVSSIGDGDIANWFELRTINHNGTHVDAPWHCNPDGKRITDLDCSWFSYGHPLLVDVPKGDDELIRDDDFFPYASLISEADMLLVRTGFGAATRTVDSARYGRRAPGFHPSAGRYLRSFPTLRAVVMDIPSAGAPAHQEVGFEFHRIVLGGHDPERFILLVEDARLDADLDQSDLHRVILAPLLLMDADGAPATVLAE